jgi:hypothetical protein
MKLEKFGCFLIYSICLIIFGMGLYKYRVEVLDYLSNEYNSLMSKVTNKVEDTKLVKPITG